MDGLTIVTGGAGFIGSHLVAQLVDSGQAVRVVERPGAAVDHLPPAVEVVFADIRDRRGLAAAMAGARRVYHLAANPNLWVRKRAEFLAVNYQGTIHVLDAALEAGADRVLHTSTESILTKAGATGPIDENVEIHLSETVGPYCRSKLLAEQYAFELARAGSPVVVANPTMPVGPGDRGLSPPTRLILDFCRGRLPAVLDCTLNLIDVRDVALGLRLIMQRGRPGRRYLLGNENLTLLGLLQRLSALTGVPVPRWRVPYWVGLTVAALSEFWADAVTGRTPKATLTGLRLARRIMHFDSSVSRAEIGLQPRSIAEALADAVSWLRCSGYLTSPIRRSDSNRSCARPN
ncbi:MAG TPA: NAD-dependent epimerase/dehydratase family protein [Isosphaeraceae bacterium]|nr:NAD-dependent epimerase/dehydratase family protein [Isosphaeraceae bacterium]